MKKDELSKFIIELDDLYEDAQIIMSEGRSAEAFKSAVNVFNAHCKRLDKPAVSCYGSQSEEKKIIL